MDGFSQIRKIKIDDYINEIKSSLKNKNYLSALSVALMIPDICQKNDNAIANYADWYNKYVFEKMYNMSYGEYERIKNNLSELSQIRLDGDVCYSLRCAFLHSGTSSLFYKKSGQKKPAKVDGIELCMNSESPMEMQYGETASITRCNGEKTMSIRINIISLTNSIIQGFEDYKKKKENTDLFFMIDWDKKGGNIIFTPKD